MTFLFNVLVSSLVIGLASWLSGRFPTATGFFVALPITTMLVLPLSFLEHGNTQNTIEFARSIFVAIPISLLFFVPFLFSDRIGLSFWQAYGLGCAALPLGYFAHRVVTRLLA
jgi:hypothetical protein